MSLSASASLSSSAGAIRALSERSAHQASNLALVSEIQKRLKTESSIAQAKATLSSSLTDSDNDNTTEAPAMLSTIAGYTPPSGGGFMPASAIGPTVDGYGMPLGYCSWDNGSANSSTGRISGTNPATNSAASLAVISSGADRSFSTSCTDASTGTTSGDDVVALLTVGMGNLGIANNVYFGRPVASKAALDALDTSLTKDGEMRVVLDEGMVYGWLDIDGNGTFEWTPLSSSGYFHHGDSNGATAGGEYTTTPYTLGVGAQFSDKNVSPDATLVVDGTAQFVSGTGVVDDDFNAQLHVGSQVATGGVAGEVNRISIQPYSHTGGPFGIIARDDSQFAYLDFRYFMESTVDKSIMTIRSPGGSTTNGFVGIGSHLPPSKLAVGGGDDATQGPVLTLHGNATEQFESGRIRFTEGESMVTGGYIHYDGTNTAGNVSRGRLHIGINDVVSMDSANDKNVLSIDRAGYLGLNNELPRTTLHIRSADGPTSDTEVIIEADPTNDASSEDYNPRLTLRQDGAQIESQFGLVGLADDHFVGAIPNATYVEGAGTATGLGQLQFVTGRDASTPGSQGAARMTIDQEGNVGIGEASPTNHLQVSQWTGNSGDYLLNLNEVRTNAGTSAFHQKSIGFSANDFMLAEIGTYGDTTDQSAASLDYLFFNVDPADIAAGTTHATPDMVINSSGQVGIQTSTPRTTLDVYGSLTVGTSNFEQNLDPQESDFQASSPLSGFGHISTPWVYTRAIEADERGAAATMIALGNGNGFTAQDEIGFVTNGTLRAKWGEFGDLSIIQGGITVESSASTKDSPALRINGSEAISFENNAHRITYNDGGGNFNIRVGNKFDGNTTFTENGYAIHTVWSQTSGSIGWNISSSSGTAGTSVSAWDASMSLNNSRLWVNKEVRAAGFVNTSDRRLKQDISPIQGGLDTIQEIAGYTYHWKDDYSKDRSLQYGFIAQDLLNTLPDTVVENEDGFYAVRYDAVTPILVEAVKEMNNKVDNLDDRIDVVDQKAENNKEEILVTRQFLESLKKESKTQRLELQRLRSKISNESTNESDRIQPHKSFVEEGIDKSNGNGDDIPHASDRQMTTGAMNRFYQ